VVDDERFIDTLLHTADAIARSLELRSRAAEVCIVARQARAEAAAERARAFSACEASPRLTPSTAQNQLSAPWTR
jgi:hypothetical protein